MPSMFKVSVVKMYEIMVENSFLGDSFETVDMECQNESKPQSEG